MNKIFQNKFVFTILLTMLALCYYIFAFHIFRHNFTQLFALVSILFMLYFVLVKNNFSNQQITVLLVFSIFVRLLFLFSIPNLSDDYFRFIWDGSATANGLNPYLLFPKSSITSNSLIIGPLSMDLYNGMNSKEYFTIYPPVLQYLFALSASIFPNSLIGNIVVLRLSIVLAEIGSIVLIQKLIQEFNFPKKNVLLYALNPLIIIELSGNLHFEAFVIFFLLAAIWFLIKNKLTSSAIFFGLSVASKLIPLILLPLLIKRIGLKKSMLYGSCVLLVLILLFVPFTNQQLISNVFSSINLYFQKFEFNASVYYVFRWFGFWLKGYNLIQTIGPILSLIGFSIILSIAFKEKIKKSSLFKNALLIFAIYYAFATIVHPWYLSTLIVLACFTNFKFQLVWSFTIFLSYYTYQNANFQENFALIALEYLLVIGALIFDFYQEKQSLNNASPII